MARKLQERVEQSLELLPLDESVQGGPQGGRRIKAIGVTADIVNGNRRRYPRAILERALEKLQPKLNESAGQGRLLVATGEAEHPSDKTGRPQVLETVVKWEAASLNEAGQVELQGVILPTSKGKDLIVLVENGVPVGVSMRGYGETRTLRESSGSVSEVTDLSITGWDIVDISQRSDPNGEITESKGDGETMPMTLAELRDLLKQQPELQESLINELGKAQRQELAESLGLNADSLVDEIKAALEARQKLAERERAEQIEQAITEATKGLRYGDELNQKFVEAVRAAKPQDADAVKAIVESKRKEYDEILTATKLAKMGKNGEIEVLGPVFEQETGQPEFVKPAHELSESLVRSGVGHAFKPSDEDMGAKRFTRQVLDLFDKQYKRHLLAEAKQFEEAEQTSDLSLPYSVSRAIIEQAFPGLVAANVFDFGTADSSPTKIFFETYAGETGAEVTVTGEKVNADKGAWVPLANARIKPSTVVVTSDPAGTTYAEGTDYVIDYVHGAIMVLAASAMADNAALLVSYQYDAIRKGEMQPIERAKQTLSSKTLEIAADRLATQISSEAVVFSRSQLGYDAVTRTLNGLVRKIQRKIDQDIFYMALAASLQQANNSGGTWASATDTLDELVEFIGQAKVKVANRYYEPNAIVMSITNADRLSNWDGYKRDGFPNAVLNAAGYAGQVKGLPIWQTPVFPDTHILVVNRELVMHRVFQAMTLKGPFPSYDNGKLVAADQYFAEEYNGTDTPVVEKAAHVVIS